MKGQLKGFSKIFSFTFIQHIKTKGYKNSTIVIAILCLLIPAAAMIGIEMSSSDGKPAAEQSQEEISADLSSVKDIYLVDLSEEKKADMSYLPAMLDQAGIKADVTDWGTNIDKAADSASGRSGTLLIITEQSGSKYTMNIVIPEESDISEDTAESFNSILMAYADSLSIASGGEAQYYGDADTDEDPEESMKQVMMMVFSFINLMVIYFFVLAYGQGVANSVVTEKSSKLMESMLVAVKPAAVIMGKLMAITLTGILQLFSWIIALAASFAVGTAVVKEMNPDSDMMVIKILDMIGNVTEGMFSPLNCALALIMIMAGMLIYCALAGIGGAMAGKAEDLSSANAIFSLVLVASFLITLYSGGIMDGEFSTSVLDWIPFTSVLITPSKVLLGTVPLWAGAASLAVTLAATVLVILAAGSVYKTLVLYKGEPLKPAKLIKMLRG